MNPALRLSIFSSLILLLLPGCGDPPPPLTSGPGIGPFDSRGYYREDWADDPSKWRRPTGRIASSDQPPPNANPLPPDNSSVSIPTRQPDLRVASLPDSEPSSRPTSRPTSKPVAEPTSRPVSKPVSKPSKKYHTVKRGDSLSAIASRYGASVSSIRQANGISGNLIHPGQKLVIPSR